jgi:hypothetical protein
MSVSGLGQTITVGKNKQQRGGSMQDMLAQLEKLRRDASECKLIRDLATELRAAALARIRWRGVTVRV